MLSIFSLDLQFISGDEYAGPCPWCGGNDRFRVWEGTGRYWCRRCEKKGDEIQFLREFKGMTYREASEALGREPKAATEGYRPPQRHNGWTPKPSKAVPADMWQTKAKAIIENTSYFLWMIKPTTEWLHDERGLTDETIKAASLGWNSSDKWFDRSEFGLDPAINEKTGKPKKVWIPAGLIIPYIVDGKVIRLRIRREKPGDGDRYIIAPGSDTRPMIMGDGQNLMVVESELDALLIHQEAGDIVSVIAMGSAQARPDSYLDGLLKGAGVILNSLDGDEAGAKEAWAFWQKNYHQVKRWPCIRGKDPGEMLKAGVNIRSWVKAGLPVATPPPEKPFLPGADCESCPACGTWDYREYAGKRLCFHRAYFIGKAGNPIDIEIQRRGCPLNEN